MKIHSPSTIATLLIGALAVITTVGIPHSAQAQKSLKQSSVSRSTSGPGDLQAKPGNRKETLHRSTDDFKLGGPDEPEFPPPSARLSRGGTLHVQGTQAKDLIEITTSGDWVEIWISDFTNENSPVEIFFDTYHVSEVQNLRIFGLAMKDVIVNSTSIPDSIWGGLGNDDIQAGNGPSNLFGQDGEDILAGNGGDDFIWGGDETDYMFGGDGSDFIHGENGRDWVSGGDVYGYSDDEVDQLVGGAGDDLFFLSPADLTDDIVTDYNPGEGDTLEELN